MINFLWMLYIALMLFATVSTIIDIVDVRASDNKYIFNDKDYFIPELLSLVYYGQVLLFII